MPSQPNPPEDDCHSAAPTSFSATISLGKHESLRNPSPAANRALTNGLRAPRFDCEILTLSGRMFLQFQARTGMPKVSVQIGHQKEN